VRFPGLSRDARNSPAACAVVRSSPEHALFLRIRRTRAHWLLSVRHGIDDPQACCPPHTETAMKGFIEDIEDRTEENSDFRRVLYTGKHLQLVLMALRPGEEIGEETHKDRDQFFRVEQGAGEAWIDGVRSKIKSDFGIVVPAGARHNIKNTGDKPLKLTRYTAA
jgi:mannose-6-phosphate isomerase-like protein (cupin superfamily)